MTHSLRVRRIIAAVLVAFALTVATATPIITDVAGLGGTASADGCEGSTC
ncbi:MAG TPA: hypothetical protein P5526_12275 [Anaerolineae bacterium]|nr:hypothetical protein [Anaerolineae bacterium]MCB0225067.1 hypothetical protein [Anaerolineae bacterium]MCB9102840.1 hypothetical protein [Anaerolineales bacterium]HRV92930.1 hypothetical protein [Anaerolineae bacterium]